MRLEWLQLRDVRCHREIEFRPDPEVNVLVGGNGAGKTTILEGIAYLATLRSIRRTPDEALVGTGADDAVIRGEFDVDPGRRRVEVALPRAGRRRVLLDGKRPGRLRDLVTLLPIVTFQPDDLDLVKRGPALRREYLDDVAAMLWPRAAADEADFERSLRQRNALLRSEGEGTTDAMLDVWDERLSVAGAAVFEARRRVVERTRDRLGATYREIGGGGRLDWRYEPPWRSEGDDPVTALRIALRRRRDRDRAARTTTVGPHRDDPSLWLDDRPARTAASQGEQRTAALALRLGTVHVVREVRGVTPVLLLDDVFSELDEERVVRVVDALPGGQVLVTTAREDEVPIGGTRWAVAPGRVIRGGRPSPRPGDVGR